uniref:Uncharacterized protein n=1 Tax=Lactuca sativa TaxID=4236 RepID=A0A9R1VK56_LACSA|nr:hypothetical protein LSAT_V11C500244930 [Lactuca sativa]
MALGTMPSSRICGGLWVTQLAQSFEVDTSGMVPIPIIYIGTTYLGKMQVLVQGDDQQWRVRNDDIVEPIRQVEPKHIPEPAFETLET